MKKMKSYILPILFFASFVFNFSTSNAMHIDNVPHRISLSEETRETLNTFSQETRRALLTLPRESCRSLLLLGTGIAGLILTTGTIRHIINSEKEACNKSETLLASLLTQASSLGRYCLGIGAGALFLATGFWGLNSKVNFNKLFGSKTLPSFLRQEPKPEEKQD